MPDNTLFYPSRAQLTHDMPNRITRCTPTNSLPSAKPVSRRAKHRRCTPSIAWPGSRIPSLIYIYSRHDRSTCSDNSRQSGSQRSFVILRTKNVDRGPVASEASHSDSHFVLIIRASGLIWPSNQHLPCYASRTSRRPPACFLHLPHTWPESHRPISNSSPHCVRSQTFLCYTCSAEPSA